MEHIMSSKFHVLGFTCDIGGPRDIVVRVVPDLDKFYSYIYNPMNIIPPVMKMRKELVVMECSAKDRAFYNDDNLIAFYDREGNIYDEDFQLMSDEVLDRLMDKANEYAG